MSQSSHSSPIVPDAGADAGDASQDDILGFYRLFLGRDAEPDVFAAYAGRDAGYLLRAMVNAPEFVARVVEPLARQDNPWADEAPPKELVGWAARRLPLTKSGASRLRKATTWAGLFQVVIEDRRFREVVGDCSLLAPAPVRTLQHLNLASGAIERADASIISGWAVSSQGDRPLLVELWVDSQFVAATTAETFRRDVQARFGGDGRAGFSFPFPSSLRAAAASVQVTVTAGVRRVPVGSAAVRLEPPEVLPLRAYRDEIRSLKALVERLEHSLPQVLDRGSVALEDWDIYHKTWYSELASDRTVVANWTVLIDANGAAPASIQASVISVAEQSRRGDQILLVVPQAAASFARDLARRAPLFGACTVRVFETGASDAGERLSAALANTGASEFVLLLDVGTVVAPPALALIAAEFERAPACQALFTDEDSYAEGSLPEQEMRPHRHPILKSGLDWDLLHQTPYVGRTLAFRTETLKAIGLREGCGGLHGPDAILRLESVPGAVRHLSKVLTTRPGPNEGGEAEREAWLQCVAEHLLPYEPNVVLGPHADRLGVEAAGPLRIRRPVAGTTAAVIIPTKDGLPLLRPCIESLRAHEAGNRTEMELRVIDHASSDPEIVSYFASLASEKKVTIQPYSGDFNWALMNNLAAAECETDVLVFLNNDTIVLSPDWLDELVGQAMREEVGVVGARLLYEDGSIQHGGFVVRGDGRHALVHDGLGVRGSNGGYLNRYSLVRSSPCVTGACFAVRRSVFESLGGFDAGNFPVEGNDVDFCFRARAAGLRVLYTPYATLYHLEAKSRGFNMSQEKLAVADAAMSLLRQRWPEFYRDDPWFNPHFDRSGRPFERLRPPASHFPLA